MSSFFGLSPERCFGVSNFSSGIRETISFLPKIKVLLIEEDYPSLSNAFKKQNFYAHLFQCNQKLKWIENNWKRENGYSCISIVQYTSGLLIDQDF